MASKPRTRIIPSGDGFAVVVGDNIIRDGFSSKQLASMWAARQKLYRGTTPPPRKPPIPADLEDECIKPTRLLAHMEGRSHWRFMVDARAGKYGQLYRYGTTGFGLRLGSWKAGRDARAIKPAA